MYVYYLSVAGVKILFETEQPLIENKEFSPFFIKATEPDLRVVVRKTENLPKLPTTPIYADMFGMVAKNEKGYLQKFFFDNTDGAYMVATYYPDGKNISIEYPVARDAVGMDLQNCFYCLGFETNLLDRSKLCLHAACVDTELGGILFSGISGIGKSTQADLWSKYRGARQINGDRPILSKEGKVWLAWGSPYAGSSKCYINDCCQVRAIVLLKQAKVCSIRRLSLSEAFRSIWAGLTVHSWDVAFIEKASMLTDKLVAEIPVYEFNCTPNEEAVKFLEERLRKEDNL